jgi:hypothetical protein
LTALPGQRTLSRMARATKNAKDPAAQPFYARETVDTVETGEPGKSTVVRFNTRSARAFWLQGDVANRTPITPDCALILAMQARGVTWEYIDGVAYAREPEAP